MPFIRLSVLNCDVVNFLFLAGIVVFKLYMLNRFGRVLFNFDLRKSHDVVHFWLKLSRMFAIIVIAIVRVVVNVSQLRVRVRLNRRETTMTAAFSRLFRMIPEYREFIPLCSLLALNSKAKSIIRRLHRVN